MTADNTVFLNDVSSGKEPVITESAPITGCAGIITAAAPQETVRKGDSFSGDIADGFISDFKKDGDLMVHVSSFAITGGMIYMTYYANTVTAEENPKYHTSRFVYCKADDTCNKTYVDLQSAGETFENKKVEAVYDTILMKKDDDTLYLMWTANLDGNYYRLYRTFTVSSRELSGIAVNRLRVGGITSDFSFSGIQSAFTASGIPYKNMYSDIGIMQKLSSRTEDEAVYFYTGAYCGALNFIIKSRDLITWEYVAQPDFPNQSKWENAVYVISDGCFYFVRQGDSKYGFLTRYDLKTKVWAKPVLIEDSQSRSDFIVFENELYLFHAPVDREHIGIIHIDTADIENSKIVLQAKMKESCFYPFVQYENGNGSRLYMSYTVGRKHIKLSGFDAAKYLG